MAEATYLRFPHLRGDELVFIADDDVWLAGLGDQADSHIAHRLSADRVPVARPRLTPDGHGVVWLSRREGEPEVFWVAKDGSAPRQLTFFGSASTVVQGFDNRGRLIVTSAAGQPFRSRTWAYAIDVPAADGAVGVAQRLAFGPVSGLAFAADGSVLVSTGYHRDPAHWKRYRGGTAGRLWLASDSASDFLEILAELPGPKTAPVRVGDRWAFLSDYQGHGNVYSVDAGGADLRRHTDHDRYYARQLAGDGVRLVYSHAGQLWMLSDLAADSDPSRLAITVPGVRAGRAPMSYKASEHLGQFSVDETALGSAIEVRGTIQWLTSLDGPVQVIAAQDGVRHRLATVVPGLNAVAYVTDAEGPDAIELAVLAGEKKLFGAGAIGRVLELAASPDGALLALATHDGRVLLCTTADGQLREIHANPAGDATGLSFAPDSRWLAFSAAEPSGLRSIRLADVASGQVSEVTTHRFSDSEPAFSNDGKYLMFLSARTFDPVYDGHVFDLSFPLAVRPYLVTLAEATPSPFDASVPGRHQQPASAAAEPGTGRHASSGADGVVVAVDLADIAERVVPFPVAAGRLSRLRAVAGGALWCDSPIAGELGESREPDADVRPSLQHWDFPTHKSQQLSAHIDSFEVSGDGSKLVIRDADALRVVSASAPPAEDGHDTIEVDLSRILLSVNPPAEWAQMVAETARLMRDHFWIEDLADVDWDDAVAKWMPVVDTINTRDDLSDVLWELNGETGSSHAYETPPPVTVQAWRQPGFLGADLSRDGQGAWRIDRVLSGDNSARLARSPLTAPGARVRAGALVRAVNGVLVGDSGPAPLLRGTAGKPTALSIEDDAGLRTVAVTPLANETGLRYLDWVASRRRIVHVQTQGRVGYVHVPDMMSAGWAAFHRDLRVEISRDALIVDTRDNGGGHTSQLVIEKLLRRVIGWGSGRHLAPETYPGDAPRGPMVSIANEWAGSDGDIVNAAFKALALGPVIGTRTWGGVIGIDGRYRLIDGTSVTQPRYSFWFEKFGWDVENHGVDPDQVVEFPPQAWGQDSDPQLAAAISYLSGQLRDRPGLAQPDLATRPSRRAPGLPPRG